MPLFDFECEYCKKHIEAILPVSRCDDIQFCPACGELARKIIVQGHGGIFRKGDASTWVREAAKVLTDDERPNPNLQSVDDFRKYLDQNPNVRPLESHPSIPSRYGDDLFVKPDLAQQAKVRSRKGHEKLREMRSITLNSAGQA